MTDSDKFGALLQWGYNNGATNVSSDQFVMNAIATSIFNTTLNIGGSENVFQSQTIPCTPDVSSFGLFTENKGCQACRNARDEFQALRFEMDTLAIRYSNVYTRPVIDDAIKSRFNSPDKNDICKVACSSCVIINANQGSRSSISESQSWDSAFDVEFQRQLKSSLASSINEHAKEMEKWLKGVSYGEENGVYKMCNETGYTGDCTIPIQSSIEQTIDNRLTSDVKTEIINSIRLYQNINIAPSQSLWISDVSQSFSANIVNEVVSSALKGTSFYNQEFISKQVQIYENNKSLTDTLDLFSGLASGFEDGFMSFIVKIIAVVVMFLMVTGLGFLLYNRLKS